VSAREMVAATGALVVLIMILTADRRSAGMAQMPVWIETVSSAAWMRPIVATDIRSFNST